METLVRVPRASDRSEWQRLWLEYLIFYESQLGPGHPDLLWGRILDPDHPIECLVAEGQGGDGLAGIAHLVPHYDTWESRRVCYLQDLFVDPARRGRGWRRP